MLVLDAGADAEAVIAQANAKLEAHQRIRGFSVWPEDALPRTSGTRKLKRDGGREVGGGRIRVGAPAAAESVEEIVRKYAGNRRIDAGSSLDDLGLSSLDRIQLLMELEQRRVRASMKRSSRRRGPWRI